jgi:uncharacterized membrane protein YfcA
MNPLALLLAAGIGVSLGLLGGGGSILTVPLLSWLGVPAREAIATSMIVVGITSFSAMINHAREGNVAWRTGGLFGAAGMVGAYAGAFFGKFLPEQLLLGLFAALMLATSVAMLRGRKEAVGPAAPPSVPRLLLLGLVFGAITGVLGAGGGFLIVPALNLLAGLTMTQAVGTSLLVITMNSLAGFAGASGHVTIDGALAAEVALAAVLGSQLGALFSKQVPAAMLRRGFAVFVLVLGVIQLANSVSGGVH